jgi:hypothetical protein
MSERRVCSALPCTLASKAASNCVERRLAPLDTDERETTLTGIVSQRDECGRTLLHWIAGFENADLAFEGVQQLLAANRCPSNFLRERDWESGWSAAHRAVYTGNLRAFIELILKDHEVLLSRDHENLSPLDLYYLRYVAPLNRPPRATCSIREVWAWGENADFQLGLPHSTRSADAKPRRLGTNGGTSWPSEGRKAMSGSAAFDADVIQIATAEQHTIFLTRDRRVYVAGFGANGRLGLGRPYSRTGSSSSESAFGTNRSPFSCLQPVRLSPPEWELRPIVYVAAGGKQSAAITACGMLCVWGSDLWSPTFVTSLKHDPIRIVDLSETHALALSRENIVYWAPADAPCKYRAIMHGALGERKTRAIAAGDGFRCAALIRTDHHDEVLVWIAGSADLRRVRFPGLTASMSAHVDELDHAPGARLSLASRVRPRGAVPCRRFAQISAAGSFVLILGEAGDPFLLRLDSDTYARRDRAPAPAADRQDHPEMKGLWAQPLQTSGRMSYRFQRICCTATVCYALDEMGCLWQWSTEDAFTKRRRGKRVPYLRGAIEVAASAQHAFAIVEARWTQAQTSMAACSLEWGSCDFRMQQAATTTTTTTPLPCSLSHMCEEAVLARLTFDTVWHLLEASAYANTPCIRESCSRFLLGNLDIFLASTTERGLDLEFFPMALAFLEQDLKRMLTNTNERSRMLQQTEHWGTVSRAEQQSHRAAAMQSFRELCARYGLSVCSLTRFEKSASAREDVIRSARDFPSPGLGDRALSDVALLRNGRSLVMQETREHLEEALERSKAEAQPFSRTRPVRSGKSASTSSETTSRETPAGLVPVAANDAVTHNDGHAGSYTTVLLLPGDAGARVMEDASEHTGAGRMTSGRSAPQHIARRESYIRTKSDRSWHQETCCEAGSFFSGKSHSTSSVEGASVDRASPSSSAKARSAGQSFRELLQQEAADTQRATQLVSIAGTPENPATCTQRIAKHPAGAGRQQRRAPRDAVLPEQQQQQQQAGSLPSLLISDTLAAALGSAASSMRARSWGQEAGSGPSVSQPCSFRKLLEETQNADRSCACAVRRNQLSPLWDRRYVSGQARASISEIEHEELQKAAEQAEATWLAEQMAIIEAMEAAQGRNGRRSHSRRQPSISRRACMEPVTSQPRCTGRTTPHSSST